LGRAGGAVVDSAAAAAHGPAMPRSSTLLAALCLLPVLSGLSVLGACGDNLAGPIDAAAPDAAPPDAPPFVEASHPAAPQVVSGGGPVMTAPVVVPIFFTGDGAMQAQVEDYLKAIATSAYWTATTHEYGVGTLTVAPTIVASDAPPTSDAALATWLAAQTDGSHAGWPAPGPNTLYAVFLPSGVSLSTPFGTSCAAFGGYHDEVPKTPIIYALMPRCQDQIDFISQVTSHELVEAVTDPHPFTATAFANLDPGHLGMELAPGGELGDMCEYIRAASQRVVGNYVVQRTWSNAAAAAGHDPCVPALAAPYVAAAPVMTEDVMIDLGADGGGVMTTKGVAVPVGGSKTIDVALYSDAPTAAWTIAPFDAAQTIGGSAPELSLTVTPTTGNNGGKVQLTIQRLRAGGQGPQSLVPNGSMFLLSSRVDGKTVSQAWGFVAN
jgi:hypothetical protein